MTNRDDDDDVTRQGQNPPAAGQTLLPASDGTIVTTLILDGNNRRTELIDDRGAVTRFAFDTLDRETAMIFHDGSTRTNVYDQANDVVLYTDENGSQFANTFDALRRKTVVAITVAPGGIVADTTTSQSFQYDGLGRTTDAKNNGTATLSEVKLFYDSIDRVLEDSQAFGGNTRNVTNTGFASYPVSQFQFPGASGRLIDNTYDALYRRQTLVEDSDPTTPIAAWQFAGPARVAEVVLANGLACTWMNNARTHSAVQPGTPGVPNPPWVAPPDGQSADRLGYDGAGRAIAKRYVSKALNGANGYSDPTSLVGFTTAFDRASNKFYERALHAEERSSLYEPFNSNGLPTGGYDSIDRLLQYQRGILASTGGDGGNGGGSVATPITLSGVDTVRSYLLDGLGNWRNTVFTPVGGSSTAEVRQHNGLNQITSYKRGSSAVVPLAYDGVPGKSNGNLAFDGKYYYTLDALNRLVEVDYPGNSDEYAFYYYDALNRRIRKAIVGGATTDCIYSGWRCVEDRNHSGDSLIAQYLWGIYLDELIQIKTLVSIVKGSGDSETTYPIGAYYPLQDLLYRTTATTNSSGVIVEAYDFDAYGNTLIFNAVGSGSSWWADDARQVANALCQFLFTGQRFDSETGLYYYKRRYYSMVLGRFLSKDPIGYAADDPNLYNYCFAEPLTMLDVLGEGNLDITGYGKYCGPRSGPGKPVDALDAACEQHDNCLASWVDFVTPFRRRYCDAQLCDAAVGTTGTPLTTGTCSKSPTPGECRIAAAAIIAVMCTAGSYFPETTLPGCHVGTTPGTPWPW